MITWNVRGRRINQTPEPASMPMPRASMISTIVPRPLERSQAATALAAARHAVTAHGLMRDRDQHQDGRADDQREDAKVEQKRARQRNGADQWNIDIGEIRAQEGPIRTATRRPRR